MSVLILAIPISLCLGMGFVAAFIWAIDHGQMQDLDSQSEKILDLKTNELKQGDE